MGLIGRALSMLFMVALAIIALLWHFIATQPLLALWTIPTATYVLYRIGRHEREKQLKALDERLRDEHVPDMSPLEYEQFASRLLERAGWSVRHCGQAGDQGCDVVAELRGFKLVVQCKLHRKPVGNSAVQAIVAAKRHYRAQIMAVVAPCGYTHSALALAVSNGVHLLHHSELAGINRLARIPAYD